MVERGPKLYDGPAAAYIHMGNLGRYLRPDWQSFSFHKSGFLRCDSELSARLRERLADGRKVIGLSWTSKNMRFGSDKKRATARLCQCFALAWLPLHRSAIRRYPCRTQSGAARSRCDHDSLPDIDNFGDIEGLAALIGACDIVVTVSNTTAHLAGALGKETYLLVPTGRARMWCWFRDRDDNPFYPRMRIRRQK